MFVQAIVIIAIGLAPMTVEAKSKKKPSAAALLAKYKKDYRLGELDDRKMWLSLMRLDGRKDMKRQTRTNLIELQAQLLLEEGYSILAAVYAAAAIAASPNPLDKKLARSWQILARVARDQPIQNILELLVKQLRLTSPPPVFGSNWFYFVGNAADRAGDSKAAIKAYSKLQMRNRYYMPARYQQGMALIANKQLKEAEGVLRSVLHPATFTHSSLPRETKLELRNYTKIALARIYYEQRNFLNSIRAYRTIPKDSSQYYDALFEQGWAFFMGGFPNHSLGALHSVDSPFFADRFNPEAKLLESMVYYWMCRYDDSRESLADFMEKHSGAVDSLGKFLDRKMLTAETAYQLFEDMVAGVSDESQTIPYAVLNSAASQDRLLLIRDQYASILEEREKLKSEGIFGRRRGVAKSMQHLDRWATALRKDLGSAYLVELRLQKKHFERLHSQAQFLYLELLMSEKEQLLGRELHASSKMSSVTKKLSVSGWGRGRQSWAPSIKEEFWWDEIGSYIYWIESKCSVRPKS